MAKMASRSTNGSRNNGNTATTAKTFSISNVEKDIYMSWTTEAIASKYGKTSEDVVTLIEQGYARTPAKIRELKKRLETSDEAARRKQEKLAKQQAAQIPAEPASEASAPAAEKSAIELQRLRVDEAQKRVEEAKKEADAIQAELTAAKKLRDQANGEVRNIRLKLRLAEEQLNTADDKVAKFEVRFSVADERRKNLRILCKKEQEKLHELCSMPVLLHSSAFGSHQVEGRVFVSQWDYDHLLDDSMKGLVTPVDTEGMKIKVYPDDFFRYPTELGMEAYNSACECALAYMKLRGESEGEKLQFVCQNELVKKLVELQG